MTTAYGVGIDVGGTFTKIAAVTAAGRVLQELELSTKPEQRPARFVERVASRLHLLSSELGQEPVGVGLGLAGDVDSEKGILRFAPSLSGWKKFHFKEAFSRRLKKPVVVDNDANMAVWGGYVTELKCRPKNVVGLTLGTGVGGGLIINGSLYRGSTGSAGEIGHTKVRTGGRPCRCGAKGCLEAYAGSYGMLYSARLLMRRLPAKSLLHKMAAQPGGLDCRLLAIAARRGDPSAREVFTRTGAALAAGISNTVLTLNPDVILLVGGISRAGGLLLGPIRKALAQEPFRTPFKRVLVRAASNPQCGCVGAALLALDQCG